ncbi:MAG: ABC transporter substrate-binding protein [Pseudoflavonifractor sp.]
MKKKLLSLALATGMVFTMAACGTPKAAPTPTAAPAPTVGTEPTATPAPTYTPATVRVAYMPNMGSASTLFTGIEQGYFEEVGLTVETTQFQGGPPEIAAMASGDIDIAQIGHGAHALCIEGQAVIVHMDQTSLADSVVGNKSKGVNTAADLKGKTIAMSTGTSSEILLQLALADAGLTMADVNTVEMDANGIVTAMSSGQVDACATWSPGTLTIAGALGDNYVKIANNADYVDKVTFPSSFITTADYADKNNDVLVRFCQALYKAQAYRATHIEDVAKLLAKKLELPEETMLQSTGEGNWLTPDFFKTAIGDGTIKKYYENQQQVFIDGGRITTPVPVENYVRFDVMQQAIEAYTAANP